MPRYQIRYRCFNQGICIEVMTKKASISTDIKSAAATFQQKLSEGLMELFDIVISSRKAYFAEHPENVPNRQSVEVLIDSYSTKNAVISGGFNLVPGPWGLVGIAPEIILVFKNQLSLIYDIGVAYGQSEILSKELLAGVLLDAFGIGAGSLFVMYGRKLLVKRASLRVFQRIIALLTGKVTQQSLASALSKWVPVLGAAAMATWVHYMTKRIGRRATEIMAHDISLDEVEADDESSVQPDGEAISPGSTEEQTAVLQKLKLLASLAAIDGAAHEEEAGYICEIMNNYEIPAADKEEILDSLKKHKQLDVNYKMLSGNPADSIGVLIDMIALSKRDGTVHPAEKVFIRKVGELLCISADDVEDLIAAS